MPIAAHTYSTGVCWKDSAWASVPKATAAPFGTKSAILTSSGRSIYQMNTWTLTSHPIPERNAAVRGARCAAWADDAWAGCSGLTLNSQPSGSELRFGSVDLGFLGLGFFDDKGGKLQTLG